MKLPLQNEATAPVIIAGAGPTGLTLATELRRGGVDVVLLDLRPEPGVEGSRAAGMQTRTIELLDQRGVVDRFLAAGAPSSMPNFAGLLLDYSNLPSRYPRALNLLQAETERILAEIAAELGTPVHWGTEVTGFRERADGVEVTVKGPNGIETLSGSYMVGCDGGRSFVRRELGVGFPGHDATMVNLLGDVELDHPPQRPVRLERSAAGLITILQFQPGWYRIVTTERQRYADPGSPVTFEEMRASVERVAGTDFGMHSARWLSSFTDATRQADRYRVGRVLLAGDAAHIHLPAGGQGMNMGMQDAFNLGWKLAAVVRGEAPVALLDTYHDERHAVGAETLKITRAQAVLFDPDPRVGDLVEVMTRLVEMREVNQHLSMTMSQLDVRYAIPGTHPLLGRRVPDIDIVAAGDKATRVCELLWDAKPVLLDLSDTPGLAEAAQGWAGRVDIVAARCSNQDWQVPAFGSVPAPGGVLIRPDGYVAWVSDGQPDLTALREALRTWLGPASQ